MELKVRHLSGSRQGEQQSFSSGPIVLGRNPANQVAFDPHKDSVVSGRHAELVFDGGVWKLRDLGSSNGTWHQGARIQERVLSPGDIVQLGKNGPQLQFDFDAPVGRTMMDESLPPAAPEGRTLMMMMDPATSAAAGGAVGIPPTATMRPVKKKGGILRALLVVAAVFLLLIVGLAVFAIMARNANMRKRAHAAAAKSAAPSTDRAVVQANQLKQQIAAKQQEIAQTQATLGQAQTTATTGSDASQVADMQRQLAESQRMIDEMTRQLQQKNDEIAAAQNKQPIVKTEVRYVPVPAPRKTATATSQSATSQSPAPGAASSPVQNVSSTPAGKTPAAVATASQAQAAQAPPAAPPAPVYPGKKLKKRILVSALPPEIPPANLPGNAAHDVATTLSGALVSTGDYVVGAKGQGSVSIMITNYKSDVTNSVDVKKTAQAARNIGGLFGQKLPTPPADVKSTSYDSAMSLRVALYDANGRTLTQLEPSAASADRKSKFSLAGVPFNQVVMSDTPTGDVARKVVGEAVEAIVASGASLDWTATVASQKTDSVVIPFGRSGNIDLGDVFEVVDGKRTLGRVRVTNVNDASAEAEMLFSPGKEKLTGKTLRYLGNEAPVSQTASKRSITVRAKTNAFDGPGNSFQKLRDLRPGQQFQLFFTVGPWARVSDGSARFWVPLAAAQINS